MWIASNIVLRQTPSPQIYVDLYLVDLRRTRTAPVHGYTGVLQAFLWKPAALQICDYADPWLCRFAKRAGLGVDPQAELTQNLRSAESHRYMQGEFLCVYDSSLRYATTKCAPPKFCSTQFCVGAKTWADLFIQHVFCNQGLPLKFISDSGAEFAGKYNQALSACMRNSWNMFTDFTLRLLVKQSAWIALLRTCSDTLWLAL